MKSEIEPTSIAEADLETQIQAAENIGRVMRHLNIRDAVTHDGARYTHDLAARTQTVVARGTSITISENTISIVLQRPGASLDGTLAETTEMTQQHQGALTGVQQSTVSRRLAKR
jgi:hypothetical protein